MKKILFIVLIVCMFALAACSPTQSVESSETETAVEEAEEVDVSDITEEMEEEITEEVEEVSIWDFDADPVTINVLSFFSSDDLWVERAVVDTFMEVYPNIIVEYENISMTDYYTLLATSIAGGVAPDVMAMNFERGAEYEDLGVLEDLTSYIEAENFNLDKYFSSTVAMHKHGGIQAALPATFSIVINFFNKSLFDEAGVSYPDENWTWDDLTSAARKMTKDTDEDGAFDQFGYVAGWWPNFIVQNGAQILNDEGRCGLNTPEAIEGIQVYVDITLDPEQQIAPNRTDLSDMGDWDRFMTGNVAMMTNGPWGIKPFKSGIGDAFEWDVAPFTGINKQATFMFGNSYAMAAASEQKAAAWEFIKYATGPEGSTLRQAGEYEISPVKEVANRDFIASLGGVPENAHYFLDATSYASLPVAHPLWGEMNDLIWTEIEQAVLGNKSAEDAMNAATLSVDTLLEENGY